ncbi:DUF4129 domain-containing protein [Pirellulaceae bacterium SH449]
MTDRKRLRPESFDYLLAALAPIFVIGMIGSLVYFLVCVLYRGSFPVRLMWILGLYTVASVLIARIAIEQSRTYSLGYMFALGAATMVATPAYLSGQDGSLMGGILVVMPLLILIAVLSDRITFDCTSMNEDVESNGVGLLQSLGLAKAEEFKQSSHLGRASARNSNEKRRHNPGVWILYFALGAVPLFAIGQLIAVDDANRAFAWKMVFVYLFSSLSLLVLIALLTLRKYLRDRGVTMEAGLASRWIIYGVTSSFLLLFLLFLIPLPNKSIFQLDLPFKITNRENLSSSRFGWGNEGVDDPASQSPKAQKGEQSTNPNSADDRGTGESKNSDSSSPDGSRESSDSKSQSSQQAGDERKSASGNEAQRSSNDQQSQQKQDSNSQENGGQRDAKQEGKQSSGQDSSPQKSKSRQDVSSQQPSTRPQTSWSIQWNPGPLFQWIAVLAILAVACFYGWLHRKEIMEFIRRLLGLNRQREASTTAISTKSEVVENRDTFSTLANPFSSRGLSREQIVTQMFQAIQAWGHDKRIDRGDEETPDEYVKRLGKRFPEQWETLRTLGFLYSRIAYARGRVSDREVQPLQSLWGWLSANR